MAAEYNFQQFNSDRALFGAVQMFIDCGSLHTRLARNCCDVAVF